MIDQNIFKYSARNNSVSINATDMKHIPFESSQRDDSNDTKFIKFQSLNAEIITKSYFYFMLHKIIYHHVNEFSYNEGLIGPDAYFVISSVDCSDDQCRCHTTYLK